MQQNVSCILLKFVPIMPAFYLLLLYSRSYFHLLAKLTSSYVYIAIASYTAYKATQPSYTPI